MAATAWLETPTGNVFVTGYLTHDFATVKLASSGTNLWERTHDMIASLGRDSPVIERKVAKAQRRKNCKSDSLPGLPPYASAQRDLGAQPTQLRKALLENVLAPP